jgi:hypothetical protein
VKPSNVLKGRDIRIANDAASDLFLAAPDILHLILAASAFLRGEIRTRRTCLSLVTSVGNLWMTAIRSRASARICAVNDSTATDRRMYDGASAIASQLDKVPRMSTMNYVMNVSLKSLTSS